MLLSVSLRVLTVPDAAIMVTSVPLPQHTGALSELARVSPSSTSTTPVVPFLTVMVPSEQLPDTAYVPADVIVRPVPSTV